MATPTPQDDLSTCRGCGAHIPAHDRGRGRHPYLCYTCSRTPDKREHFGGPEGDGVTDVPHTPGRWRATVHLRSGSPSIIASCDTHRAACDALATHVESLPQYVIDRIARTEVSPAKK